MDYWTQNSYLSHLSKQKHIQTKHSQISKDLLDGAFGDSYYQIQYEKQQNYEFIRNTIKKKLLL